MRASAIVMALCAASASAFLSPTVLRASTRTQRAANTITEATSGGAELARREALFAGAAGVLSLGLAPGSASAKKLSYKEVRRGRANDTPNNHDTSLRRAPPPRREDTCWFRRASRG